MQPITKQKYFYYVIMLMMASAFLPLLFNNLPHLIRSHHIWTIVWGVSLVVFYPKIFLNKLMVLILAYGLFLFIATETIWISMDTWNKKLLFNEFYQITIGISVFTYFHQSKDYISFANITKWAIVFLFITAIMTIISSGINPMYARNLTGLSAVTNENEIAAILSFKRFGGGTYSTAGAFMCVFPLIIYYYRNIKISLISKRVIIILCMIFFLALVGMQIFGNILVAIIFSIIALLGMKRIRQSVIAAVFFFSLVLLIPKEIYVNRLLSLGSHFDKDSDLKYKINDMATFIETGADIKDNSTGVGGRVERYPILMETFIKKPVSGCFFFSDKYGNGYSGGGAHLHWMNKLIITGIIGFGFFIYILFTFIRKNLKLFNPTFKFYYILASLSIISYGLMKVIAGRETWYAFFIILPGLYYLPLLKDDQ